MDVLRGYRQSTYGILQPVMTQIILNIRYNESNTIKSIGSVHF